MKLQLSPSLRRAVLSCMTTAIGVTASSRMASAGVKNLTYDGSSLTWNTEDAIFVNADEEPAAFSSGDNVYFTGKSTVTLGEDISVGVVSIGADADVIILQDNYTLEAERIELAGALVAGDTLNIDNGAALAVVSAPALLNSNLVLGSGGTLACGAAANLNSNTLTLRGGSGFQLTASGDGKTYTLFTGVAGLKDAHGNTIALNSTNNAISNYFDATQPGTGFWADATLMLTDNGTLQLIRHEDEVKGALELHTHHSSGEKYLYYASVSFSDIEKCNSLDYGYGDCYGGAIGSYVDRGIELGENGSVIFKNNKVSSNSCAGGGAIAGGFSSTIELSHNGSVEFSGNEAIADDGYDASGGAIKCWGDIILSDNGNVVFSENDSISSYHVARGGAIECGGNLTIANNGIVSFKNNSSKIINDELPTYASGGAIAQYRGELVLSNNSQVFFSGNRAGSGGAISADNITLNNNGCVIFRENEACGSYANGGAIYSSRSGEGNIISVNNNGTVEFIANVVSGTYAHGGAISGAVEMRNNGSIEFNENTAASAGGAINGAVTISSNARVTFSRNNASTIGGAIAANVALTKNGSLSFEGNTADVAGGAIAVWSGGELFLEDNDVIVFEDNMAGYGGSIEVYHAGAEAKITNNGQVLFADNYTIVGKSTYNPGGAIHVMYDSSLAITNNDDVIFEKNAEISTDAYRLRSIFIESGLDSVSAISLSAAEDKKIEFRDSLFVGVDTEVCINAGYTDANNKIHPQQGDIVITGAYTETHLNEVLSAHDAGRTATDEEILQSRTSEINSMTNLYGGRLRVEDGALYKGNGITAHTDSAATVRVKDAELSHVGYDIEFNADTALEVAGTSTIRGNVKLLEESTFKLEQAATLSLHETLEADVAMLSVNGTALLEGNSTLNACLTLADGATLDMDVLDAGTVTLNGALTFAGKVCMGSHLRNILSEMRGWEESVNLFTGLTNLVLPDTVNEDATGRVWVGDVFSNMGGNQTHYLTYEANVGSLSVVYVPETTTTTLSLLALAGLTMRRRRK